MIHLDKWDGVQISESQKQQWIREMWDSMKKTSRDREAILSGDTMIEVRLNGGKIEIFEYHVSASTILSVKDFEKKLAEK